MSTWYLSQAGQQQGPLSHAQLQQMAAGGGIGPEAFVSGPGLNGWVPASQVATLWQAVAPSPAMGPPGAPASPEQGRAYNAAFPLGLPPEAAPRGEPKSSWVKERIKGLRAIGVALLVLLANGVLSLDPGQFLPRQPHHRSRGDGLWRLGVVLRRRI
jgi:hypothetical protein